MKTWPRDVRSPMRALLACVAACATPSAPPLANSGRGEPVWTDATLVDFEPDGGGCVLRQRDPVTRSVADLGRFPGRCLGARIAWTVDLHRAVVWFDPEQLYRGDKPGHPEDPDGPITEAVYEVDLVHHAVAMVAKPPERVQEIAFGADGTLYAFAEHTLANAKGKVVHLGHVLDFSAISEGLPAAAVTYARTRDGWTLASVTATTTGWDYARGWSEAPQAKTLGPRSEIALDGRGGGAEIDPATRAQLARLAPPENEDTWARLDALPVYVWVVSGEFAYMTGRLAWQRGGTFEPLPEVGFTATEIVAVRAHGNYVLVGGSNSGAYPRLYDVAARRLVYTSNTARCAMFVPH